MSMNKVQKNTWSFIIWTPFKYYPPDKVSCPTKHNESYGGLVMDEHLPEVLPLDIKELAEAEWPVESQLQHVVEPQIKRDLQYYINKWETL